MSKFQPFPSTNCFATKLLGEGAAVLFISSSVLIHRGLCILFVHKGGERCLDASFFPSSLISPQETVFSLSPFFWSSFPFVTYLSLICHYRVLAELGLCLSSQLFLNSLKKGVTRTLTTHGVFQEDTAKTLWQYVSYTYMIFSCSLLIVSTEFLEKCCQMWLKHSKICKNGNLSAWRNHH